MLRSLHLPNTEQMTPLLKVSSALFPPAAPTTAVTGWYRCAPLITCTITNIVVPEKAFWLNNDGRTKETIDLILINRSWLSSVRNCCTHRCVGLGKAGHRLLAADTPSSAESPDSQVHQRSALQGPCLTSTLHHRYIQSLLRSHFCQ